MWIDQKTKCLINTTSNPRRGGFGHPHHQCAPPTQRDLCHLHQMLSQDRDRRRQLSTLVSFRRQQLSTQPSNLQLRLCDVCRPRQLGSRRCTIRSDSHHRDLRRSTFHNLDPNTQMCQCHRSIFRLMFPSHVLSNAAHFHRLHLHRLRAVFRLSVRSPNRNICTWTTNSWNLLAMNIMLFPWSRQTTRKASPCSIKRKPDHQLLTSLHSSRKTMLMKSWQNTKQQLQSYKVSAL